MDEDFGMWRDVEPPEIERNNKPTSKWEILFWICFMVTMCVAEVVIVRFKYGSF